MAALMAQYGKPYIFATEGPDTFDCSGLVYYCLRLAGVNVSRWSAADYANVQAWEEISDYHDLIRGDLIFFRSNSSSNISHVAVYLGNGTYIHASSSAGCVTITDFGPWSQRNFVLGRRVF